MKKLLLAASFVLAFTFLTSCGNEDTIGTGTENNLELTQTDVYEVNMLQNQIANYNSTHFEAQPQTRGWIKNLFKGLLTAFADAVGGVIGSGAGGVVGGVAGGTVASGLVGLYVFSDKEFNPEIKFGGFKAPVKDYNTVFSNLVVSRDSVSSYLSAMKNDSIGYYHNAILYDVFKDSTKLAKACEMTDEEFGSYLLDRVDEVYHINKDQVIANGCVEKSITIVNVIGKTFSQAQSKEYIIDELSNKLSIDKEIIDLLLTYIEGAMASAESGDNDKYLQDMLDILEKANLSPEVKGGIRDGFIIGNASSRLWNINDMATMSNKD